MEQHNLVTNEIEINTETNDDTTEKSTADDGDVGNKADIDTANDDYVEDNPVNVEACDVDLAHNDIHYDTEHSYMIKVNIAKL